jgi:hypothetical protein
VQPAVASFKMNGFFRVVFRHRVPEHGPKGDGESLGQSRSGIRYFSKYVWHTLSKTQYSACP